MKFKYVTENEIAVSNFDDAMKMTDILLANDYVVAVSREEELYIINYVWSPNKADRNDVCFQDRSLVEDFIFNESED